MTKLWVQFKTNNAVKVSTNSCKDVDDFLRACKKEFSSTLGSYDVCQLSLSFTADGSSLCPVLLFSEIPLQPDYLANDYSHPFFIRAVDVSPEGLAGPARSLSESRLNAPHPKRKERWEQLNAILARNKKKSKTNSTAYSYVSWNDVKHVLKTTPYTQSSKAIPDIEFGILSQYLSFATKCFGPITSGKESQRLHLIAPIIICVCILFKGEVTIEVEEDLCGQFLKAHGHFEFMLSRGGKRVCIVEAKRDDMCQGLAQDLLGCEVAAEVGHLDSVYGIVTNYLQWNFLRSLDEKIEFEECCLWAISGQTMPGDIARSPLGSKLACIEVYSGHY